MADTKFSLFTDGGDAQVGDTVVGLRSGSNYKFSFPGSGIKDSSGNYLFKYTAAGAASVNYVLLTNASTGNGAIIESSGSDADVDLIIRARGNGVIQMPANLTQLTQVQVDNITIDGNTISVTNTNGDLNLAADGTGIVSTVSPMVVGEPGTEGSGITVHGVTYNSHLKVSDIADTHIAQTIIHRHSTTLAPLIVMARSHSNDSSHAIVQDGDNVMWLIGTGWDGVDYEQAASITFEIDGTPGVDDMPGRIVFYTTPDGGFIPLERLRIDNAGLFTLNSSTGIDAVIDDDTMATASATNVSTSEAVKTYVDTQITAGVLPTFLLMGA